MTARALWGAAPFLLVGCLGSSFASSTQGAGGGLGGGRAEEPDSQAPDVSDGSEPDASADSQAPDASSPDAGAPDASPPDSGAPDASPPDGGPLDASQPDAACTPDDCIVIATDCDKHPTAMGYSCLTECPPSPGCSFSGAFPGQFLYCCP